MRVGSALDGRRSAKTTLKLFDDGSVVKEHAEIYRDPRTSRWYVSPWQHGRVEPCEIRVNGVFIDRPTTIQHGAVLQIGRLMFRFELRRESAKQPSMAMARAVVPLILLTGGATLANAQNRADVFQPTNITFSGKNATVWVRGEHGGSPAPFVNPGELQPSEFDVTWISGSVRQKAKVKEIVTKEFSARKSHVYYLIAIDTSGSMSAGKPSRAAKVRAALDGFLDTLAGNEQVAIRLLGFDVQVPAVDNILSAQPQVLDSNWGGCSPESVAALKKWNELMMRYVEAQPLVDRRRTSLNQALRYAVREAAAAVPQGEVAAQTRVLLLTDGRNETKPGDPHHAVTFDEALDAIRSSGVYLQTVGYDVSDEAARDALVKAAEAGRSSAIGNATADQLAALFQQVITRAWEEIGLVVDRPEFLPTGWTVEVNGTAGKQDLRPVSSSWLLGATNVGTGTLGKVRMWRLLTGALLFVGLGAAALLNYAVGAMRDRGSVAQATSPGYRGPGYRSGGVQGGKAPIPIIPKRPGGGSQGGTGPR